MVNSPTQLKVRWDVPYSHQEHPVESYNIQIVNMNSGNVLESLLGYTETNYVYTFDDDVQYCQILTVSITAVSAVGQSNPASVSRGIRWDVPYSHQEHPVESYNIQIVNMNSGNVLESLLGYTETNYVYTFDDDVQYCQILTVSITAVSAVGQSNPASVSRGIIFLLVRQVSLNNIMKDL